MIITKPSQRSITIFNRQWVNIVKNYKGPHTLITYSYQLEVSGRTCWYLYGRCGNCGEYINMRKDVFFRSSKCDLCSRLSGHNYKDGRSNNPLYAVYHGMIARCYNTNNRKYARYGQRGITVHKAWVHSFAIFNKWAINNGYKHNKDISEYKDYLAIDRIDNDGNYEPSNCQWITVSANSIKKVGNYNV